MYVYRHTHIHTQFTPHLKKVEYYHTFDDPVTFLLILISLLHLREEPLSWIFCLSFSYFLYNFNTCVYTRKIILLLLVITKN